MSYNPAFLSTDSFGDRTFLTNLENNMKLFLDWGFLNIGAYQNVSIPSTNIHNFNLHLLRPKKDATQLSYKVWISPKKDWVHESGVCFKNESPLAFSGLYINNVFYPGPTGNSTIGYKVDYPNGQILFNSAVPPTSIVAADYSYKIVQVYKSNSFPQWKEIQLDSSLNSFNQFQKYDTGDFALDAEHRVQLPSIIIDIDSRSTAKPFRLGDRSLIISQDILLHVLSDNKNDRNTILDIVRLQKDRYVWLFDTNKVIQDKKYELNFDGSINTNGTNYHALVNNPTYRWKLSRITDVSFSDITFYHMNLFGSTIRLTQEIIYEDFSSTCFVEDESSGFSGVESLSLTSSSESSGSSSGFSSSEITSSSEGSSTGSSAPSSSAPSSSGSSSASSEISSSSSSSGSSSAPSSSSSSSGSSSLSSSSSSEISSSSSSASSEISSSSSSSGSSSASSEISSSSSSSGSSSAPSSSSSSSGSSDSIDQCFGSIVTVILDCIDSSSGSSEISSSSSSSGSSSAPSSSSSSSGSSSLSSSASSEISSSSSSSGSSSAPSSSDSCIECINSLDCPNDKPVCGNDGCCREQIFCDYGCYYWYCDGLEPKCKLVLAGCPSPEDPCVEAGNCCESIGFLDECGESPITCNSSGSTSESNIGSSGSSGPTSGSDELPTSGSSGTTSGSSELTSGSSEPTSGSSELTSGSSELTSGSSEPTSGSSELTSGSSEPTSGSSELTSGSSGTTSGSSGTTSNSTSESSSASSSTSDKCNVVGCPDADENANIVDCGLVDPNCYFDCVVCDCVCSSSSESYVSEGTSGSSGATSGSSGPTSGSSGPTSGSSGPTSGSSGPTSGNSSSTSEACTDCYAWSSSLDGQKIPIFVTNSMGLVCGSKLMTIQSDGGTCLSGSSTICGAQFVANRCCIPGCDDYTDCGCWPDNSTLSCATGSKLRFGCGCMNGGSVIWLPAEAEEGCECCGCDPGTCIPWGAPNHAGYGCVCPSSDATCCGNYEVRNCSFSYPGEANEDCINSLNLLPPYDSSTCCPCGGSASWNGDPANISCGDPYQGCYNSFPPPLEGPIVECGASLNCNFGLIQTYNCALKQQWECIFVPDAFGDDQDSCGCYIASETYVPCSECVNTPPPMSQPGDSATAADCVGWTYCQYYDCNGVCGEGDGCGPAKTVNF